QSRLGAAIQAGLSLAAPGRLARAVTIHFFRSFVVVGRVGRVFEAHRAGAQLVAVGLEDSAHPTKLTHCWPLSSFLSCVFCGVIGADLFVSVIPLILD